MPTLPLYTPNDVPDAAHRVIGPGGYEWWHFDAESTSGKLFIIARLGVGFPFSSEYQQKYARYLRRPTRHPPPAPADYPFVECAVFEDQTVVAERAEEFPKEQFSALNDRPAVRLGANEFSREPDGSLRLQLRTGARGDLPGSLSVDLVFTPLLPYRPHDVELSALPAHHWVVADALCEVAGSIRLSGGSKDREIEFRGRGYHDHVYGVEPPGLHATRWLRGRLLLERRAVSFQIADGVEADAAGVLHLPISGARLDWTADGRGRPQAPREIRIDLAGREDIVLAEPRLIGRAGHFAWSSYSAVVGGKTRLAMCEVVDYLLPGGG